MRRGARRKLDFDHQSQIVYRELPAVTSVVGN